MALGGVDFLFFVAYGLGGREWFEVDKCPWLPQKGPLLSIVNAPEGRIFKIPSLNDSAFSV